MCIGLETAVILSIVASLASTATTTTMQAQAAKKTTRSAEEAASFEARQARARAYEEGVAASDAKMERSRQHAAQMGQVQAADLPERSVSSLGRLLAVEKGLADTRARTNYEFGLGQTSAAIEGAGITLRSRTSGLPSTAGLITGGVLSGIGSSLSIYSAGQTAQARLDAAAQTPRE